MSITQFLSILRARWMAIVVIFLLTVGAAVGITLQQEKQYTATATVILDIKSPDPIMGVIVPGLMAPSYMTTQADILKSDRVARKVLKSLKQLDSPGLRQRWLEVTQGKGDFEAWLIDGTQRNLSVDPAKESNIINVSYKGADPKTAAITANAFVQAYIDTASELRVDPAKQYSTFFDTRVKQAREDLERAQSKLSAFQQQRGIIANDERLDVENSRLMELSQQIVVLQAISAESNSRQTAAAVRPADQLQDVIGNSLLIGLKSDLARQEARLQEIGSRLGDNHPQVLELKATIGELRRKIESETKKITSSVGVTNQINRQRESEVRAAYDAQRAKLLKLKELRDEGSVLIREVESAQRSFDTVMARFNQTSLESQNTLTNASILNQAFAPAEASSPKVALNITAAVLVGLALALGTALLMEFINRRVRTVEDLSQALGAPVIGVMRGSKPGGLLGGRQSLLARRVLGELPAPKSRGG